MNKPPAGGGLTPEELHAAYGLPTETFSGPDLAVFDKQFDLPACTSANGCFRKINEKGNAKPLPSTQGEWALEELLDVDMAHAICQDCHILLVEASNEEYGPLGNAVNTAVKEGATEISNSYEGIEEGYVKAGAAAPRTTGGRARRCLLTPSVIPSRIGYSPESVARRASHPVF